MQLSVDRIYGSILGHHDELMRQLEQMEQLQVVGQRENPVDVMSEANPELASQSSKKRVKHHMSPLRLKRREYDVNVGYVELFKEKKEYNKESARRFELVREGIRRTLREREVAAEAAPSGAASEAPHSPSSARATSPAERAQRIDLSLKKSLHSNSHHLPTNGRITRTAPHHTRSIARDSETCSRASRHHTISELPQTVAAHSHLSQSSPQKKSHKPRSPRRHADTHVRLE